MAIQKNHLIASGLLYEGNFSQWKDRMSAIFVTKGQPQHAYPSIYKFVAPFTRATFYWRSTYSNILAMRNQISPRLLQRLPLDLKISIGAFYAQLERFTTMFRLMDLPAELRVRIYEEVLEDEAIEPFFSEPWKMKCSRRMPALAQASQQLRNEILPIYFATTEFTFDANFDVPDPWLGYGYCDTMASIVKPGRTASSALLPHT